ncbi:uncharacterized protein LOC121697879 [Alosa sapidissima]|uniref:uncharacterized protein LOC121697879 n=1 Tax=Alosa sapidissima TaxID=34773 RepID=UPI001C090AC8|nr:uncharacterized protein LOC121697879 [Alosa sapidissima]
MIFFHNTNHIKIEDKYKDRLIFNTTTFSLELRNLRKNDSGLYTCEIRWDFNITIVVYKLFVLEPVAAPALTLVSNWSSSNSCDVTVTCRGHDLSLTFSCNRSSCTQLGDILITPTLVVFARDGYIVCNHSNQVSWHNVTLDMSSLCEFAREEDSTQWTVGLMVLLTAGLIFAGIVAACVVICICRSKRRRTGTDSTDYADIIWLSHRTEVPERATGDIREQNERVKSLSNLTPEPQPFPAVIYSLLQPPRPESDVH